MAKLLDVVVQQAREQSLMTFTQLVKGCTDDEREQLVWHLAMMRARKTFEILSKITKSNGD